MEGFISDGALGRFVVDVVWCVMCRPSRTTSGNTPPPPVVNHGYVLPSYLPLVFSPYPSPLFSPSFLSRITLGQVT